MAFESLTEKLQNVFRGLRSKGKLTEGDIKAALKEVKVALLEADVNFRIVRKFIRSVEADALGEEVLKGLNPGQMVIKIVHDKMVELMGSELTEIPLRADRVTVIMMVGLQGAGKTTTAAKLAGKFKASGKSPLLAAADVYRPAAIRQLEINAQQQQVPVFSMGDREDPVVIAEKAVEEAARNGNQVLLIDTAGRLQIDEDMMRELAAIKERIRVDQTILVVDAMTGQEAVNVAESFSEKVGIDGVILTKCDGDMRGGAALSVKAVTGKPIYYVGMGEKLSDLELFYPDRMASRILGMGDVMSLIEKAQESMDEEKAMRLQQKIRKASFDFNDYLESIHQMRNMGGLENVLSMLPGMGMSRKDLGNAVDEKAMAKTETIILSMTKEERANPELLNVSRKQRIARGSGCDMADVNRLVKQFEQSRKMMKQLPGLMGGGKKRKGIFGGMKFPFGM